MMPSPQRVAFPIATLTVAAVWLLAVRAYAEPDAGIDTAANSVFVESLRQAGIVFAEPQQAIASAQAVCGLAAQGESGLELLTDLQEANPGLTLTGAAQFATIAAKAYCPHQITSAGSQK